LNSDCEYTEAPLSKNSRWILYEGGYFQEGCDDMDKNQRKKKETQRLTKIYKKLSEDKYKTALKLIDNLAFMSVTLEDLMEIINNDELVKTTINASQSFVKEHPALASYNKMYANYLKGIQQLSSLLPKDFDEDGDDNGGEDLMTYIKNKNSR